MSSPFFDHPILNSPYECPQRHWELYSSGQPTQQIIEKRRGAEFITPIPKPKKRKAAKQAQIVFNEGKGLSTGKQQYDPTSVINEVHQQMDTWRVWAPGQWQVNPRSPACRSGCTNVHSEISAEFHGGKRPLISESAVNFSLN